MTSISKKIVKILNKIKHFSLRPENIGASHDQAIPEGVMDLGTLIETHGGSVVHGDVHSRGDFVGRDKSWISD